MQHIAWLKKPIIKFIISLVVVLAGIVVIRLISEDHTAEVDGFIHLTMIDLEGETIFDEDIPFYQGDSFYDILDRQFDLICATATYAQDETCSYTFNNFAYQGKVILGIKHDDVEIVSNWSNTFLAFYTYHESEYILSTVGPSNIPFENGDRFMIKHEHVGE